MDVQAPALLQLTPVLTGSAALALCYPATLFQVQVGLEGSPSGGATLAGQALAVEQGPCGPPRQVERTGQNDDVQ